MADYSLVRLYSEGRSITRSQSTATQNRETLNRLLSQFEQMGVTVCEETITGLTGIKLQQWFNAYAKTHKPASINYAVITLNTFLRWAYSAQALVGKNGAAVDLSGVLHTVRIHDEDELPEEERAPSKYLSREQVKELMNCHSGRNRVRDNAIIALLLSSGLRVSELCSLNVGDLKKEHLSIRRKGGHYAEIVIGSDAAPFIQAYLATRPNAADDEPLFITSHGSRCSRVQVYKSLSTRQKACGVATGPHALRHTFVSEVDRVSSAGVARDCANHKHSTITDRYTHTTIAQRQQAVDSLHWFG